MLPVRVIFLPLFFLYLCASGNSTIKIKGCVKGIPYPKVYFAGIAGGQNTYLDSAQINNGCFDFYLSDTLPTGMYSLIFSKEQNSFIRVLLNSREDIVFSTVFNKMLDSLVFTASVENQVYYSYIKNNALITEKRNLINSLIKLSAGKPALIRALNTDMAENENSCYTLGNSLQKQNPNSLASVFIQALTPLKIPAKVDTMAYVKAHFLDNINFANPVLHRSDLLASAIMNFLAFLESPKNTFMEQVENYCYAIDHILVKAKANELIYNFYRKELEGRYMYGNYDIVGNFLSRFYNEKPPQEVLSMQALRQKIIQMNCVTIGKKAPRIVMPGYNGKEFSTEDINNEYTLLVFWSTTCFHCTEMLPSLKKIYDLQKKNNLEVLAISFDTDKNAWQDFIKNGNYSWLNYNDLKGWDSEIAATYNIKGTPTYILLDKNKWVVRKPKTLEELAQTLQSMNIL
jgi:peroxiredoxin